MSISTVLLSSVVAALFFQIPKCARSHADEAEDQRPNPKLLPAPVVGEPRGSDGCWARLYDGYNFKGRVLELVGPTELESMLLPNGIDWRQKTKSIEVGSNAILYVFKAEGFRNGGLSIQPAIREYQLETKLDDGQVRSARLRCVSNGSSDGVSSGTHRSSPSLPASIPSGSVIEGV